MDTRAAPAAVHMNRLKLHRAERSSFKMDWGTVETDLRSDPSTQSMCGWVCGRGSIRPVELAAGTSGQAPSVLKAIHRYQSSSCSVQTCFSDAAFMFEWDDAKAQNASVAPARLQSRPLTCCSVSCNDEFLHLKRVICSLCSIVKTFLV